MALQVLVILFAQDMVVLQEKPDVIVLHHQDFEVLLQDLETFLQLEHEVDFSVLVVLLLTMQVSHASFDAYQVLQDQQQLKPVELEEVYVYPSLQLIGLLKLSAFVRLSYASNHPE
jgi:hypothetical protein